MAINMASKTRMGCPGDKAGLLGVPCNVHGPLHARAPRLAANNRRCLPQPMKLEHPQQRRGSQLAAEARPDVATVTTTENPHGDGMVGRYVRTRVTLVVVVVQQAA